jgi:hypothetical protein
MSQQQRKPGSGFSNKAASESTSFPTSQSSAPSAADALAKLDEVAANVKVIHGANDGDFALAGSKVATVRASLVQAFNIPGDALAFVNGEQVDGTHSLQANDVLEFVKQAGVKGKNFGFFA